MIVIPAIDIKDGRCVRLLQGRADAATVYSDHPAATAQRWEAAGAELIHVIDLDGAFAKKPRNLEAVGDIVRSVSVPIQLGGGIRDMETIDRLLALGVERIILGTEAIRNPDLVRRAARTHPHRIILGIDAREGRVAIEGWTQTTEVTAVALARRFEDCPLAAVNFTDIHRDGMQTGPNLEQTRLMAEAVAIPVVASGGVSGLKDIERLLPLESVGVVGVITGKALYSGALDLRAAIEFVRQSSNPVR
jgi:phosphoribosylformimino-5-aminoimidazole carboxamide ribotide isomerase